LIQTRTKQRNITSLWVTALLVPFILTPIPVAYADNTRLGNKANSQSFEINSAINIEPPVRDTFTAEMSLEAQIRAVGAERTNYAWAKIVLMYGGFPVTEHNIQTFLQWMRQENYVDSWWQRNNPLNNGWYTVGSYMGTNTDLYEGAEKAARAIANYPSMYESFMTGNVAPDAIMFSGWASGMYNNGKHWSLAPVPVIEAPAHAWGE
jgi:hypothetical protein